MGTLGQYLRSAREAMGIDLRDAAQQTRISANYLKALEEEDFMKLPGEVFVKGFLKSYGRFLRLEEREVMKRYAELEPQLSTPYAAEEEEKQAVMPERVKKKGTPIEPFIWAAVIVISLIVFLVTTRPNKNAGDSQSTVSAPTGTLPGVGHVQPAKPEKLYLEVVALEDTWLLVRTDASPQKKALLKKGENLIWSADDTFLLSYSDIGAVKLLLNGEELSVQGAKGTVVRDLVITRAGIASQQLEPKQPKPAKSKPKPSQPQAQHQSPQQQPTPQPEPPVQHAPAPAPTSPALSPLAPVQ